MSDRNRPLESRGLESTTAERLAAIVEAAEAAATKVIDDAEAEAQRHLAESRSEAARILARARALLEGLSAAQQRLEAELGSPEGAAADGREAPRPRTHLSAVEPVEESASPPAPAEPGPLREESPAGARLLATQMAVSGNSREEIASRLRNGFQIEDTDAILDAILGPEG